MIKFTSATEDENKNASGGVAGDQTGLEVRTREAYNHELGWRIFRHPDKAVAKTIAANAIIMANNENIGYDQGERNTVYEIVKENNWDINSINKPCECDCSSLVRTCVASALKQDVYNFSTANEADKLMELGFKEIYDIPLEDLLTGDILCTKIKGHTEICSCGKDGSSD